MKRVLAVVVALLCAFFSVGVASALACPPPPRMDGATGARALFSAQPDISALSDGDPFYYTAILHPRPTTTHSKIPHLPFYTGFMQTNDTYRFLTVAEQVFNLVGEGKHGLWRVQENGMVREYLRKGATGLPAGADLADPGNLATLERDYAAFLPDEGAGGYKDPFEPLNAQGMRNFVDLPITHARYGGRYKDHEPIDLPHWYCTMSIENFPEAAKAAGFAFAQPGANKVGPLGRRAGLDIKENYTNVLRLEPYPDARAWVNVGDETDVHWKAIDVRRTNAEFYLYERPFFNMPYLFLTAVFDDRHSGDFRYVRPDGPYYEGLRGRRPKTTVTLTPRFSLERGGSSQVTGTRLYGVHHPDRPAAYGDKGGGACPQKGGDWDGYPDTKGGAGWPTQYEEVTPLCDGVLVDLKFFANLDGRPWNDETKYLANAGAGQRSVTYNVQEGTYGRFTDPYFTERGVENPHAAHIGPKETLRYRSVQPPVGYVKPGE